MGVMLGLLALCLTLFALLAYRSDCYIHVHVYTPCLYVCSTTTEGPQKCFYVFFQLHVYTHNNVQCSSIQHRQPLAPYIVCVSFMLYFSICIHSKLRRRRTTILRTQLCVSLLVLLLAYAGHILINYTTTLPQDVGAPCTVVSVVTHYFTLTSLVWLGAETLLMFRKLVFDRRLGDVSNLYFVTVSATSWSKSIVH